MTIGTGFFGRSSLGENLEPRHLINLTRVAYADDPAEPFGDFTGLAAVERGARRRAGRGPRAAAATSSCAREEIRRMVLEELRELVQR